jgi:metal-responsive CopG/Arc/MetJ family transcriptional regulator
MGEKMKRRKEPARSMKPASTSSVRATISFPTGLYQTIEAIAKQKKVSLAWVVREAVEQYVGEKWPLLFRGEG